MSKINLKFGETSIPCVPSWVATVSNVPKERKGVITSVSELDGNTHIEICSTEYNRSRQELTLDIVGPTPAWAILGSELEYETGHE
jgi:hypothetical protein